MKPNKSSGTQHKLLTEGCALFKFITWKFVRALSCNAIIYTNDNTWHQHCLSCWMEREYHWVDGLRHNESRWKPTTLHQNQMSYGQQAWKQANAVKSCVTWTCSGDLEFLWIGSACLMNVSRVHVGPVNSYSNVMKQPLSRGNGQSISIEMSPRNKYAMTLCLL